MNVARSPGELELVRRALAVGTFDGVHLGHRRVIEATQVAGLRSTVVTFDPHPRTILGNRVELLSTLDRRLELIAELGVEDVLVLRFDEDLIALSAEAFADSVLRAIGAEVIAAGDGFRFGHGRTGDLGLLERLGFDVRRVPLVDGISSSHTRKLLAGGDVVRAAGLLGRPPEVEGTVVLGDQRGGTSSCPRTVCMPAPHSAVRRRSRSGRTRTTAAPSDASRHTCSTSRATCTARAFASSCGSGFAKRPPSVPRPSSSRRSPTTSAAHATRAARSRRGASSSRRAEARSSRRARFPGAACS